MTTAPASSDRLAAIIADMGHAFHAPGPGLPSWLAQDLTLAQVRTLFLIAHEAPLPMGRIAEILVALQSAEQPLTSLLVSALSRMPPPEGPLAIEAAFAVDNIHARRSSALVLAALDSVASRSALEAGRLGDPDDEVRRICAAALR